MDKKAIETLAVNAVRDTVVVSDYLDQFIQDNDKEPSWDGNIYIYDSPQKNKDCLRGRLPVQVKGKEQSDFSKKKIKYPISTIDLRNYLKDGGVIYFVVYISKEKKQIYYLSLPPVKINLILKKAKKQKTISLELKKLPKDISDFESIVFNCLDSCNRQKSYAGTELLTLDELKKIGVLEGLSIPFIGTKTDDIKKQILSNEVYLYAKVKGNPILQPLSVIPEKLHISEIINNSIVIDGTVYYSSYNMIRSEDGTTFQFGDSFKIIFDNNEKPCKIRYSNSQKVRALAKDLDFLLQYIEKGYFSINDIKLPFDKEGADFSNFDIENEKERLVFAKRTVRMLDRLGCNKDIDLSQLSDEDLRNIHRLNDAFIDGKKVSNLKENLPLVTCMNVGKLKFALLLLQDKSNKHTYTIKDFFDVDIDLSFDDNDGIRRSISQFTILDSDNILDIDNLKSIAIKKSIIKTTNSSNVDRINYLLLDIIKAFDKSNASRIDLISLAEDIAKWIIEQKFDSITYQVIALNYLQIIKRNRNLNADEEEQLWNIIEDSSTDDTCKVGAYLLLEQYGQAKKYFEKLEVTQKEEFEKYPIYHFWDLMEVKTIE